MDEKPNEPGPGRSTSAAAFDDIRKKVAERNETAHKAARKLRDVSDHLKARERRERDLR